MVDPTSRQYPDRSVIFGAPDAWTGSPIPPSPSADGFGGVLNQGQLFAS